LASEREVVAETPVRTIPGIAQFRGALAGQTVVVLGAGGLDYMRPSALAAFPIISVNSSARKWGIRPDFVVVKEHRDEAVPNAVAFPDTPIIASRWEFGHVGGNELALDLPNVHVYDHRTNAVENFDAAREWPTEPDQLVVSMSTMTTAMHAAAYMGAAVILVVGLVCGTLEGRTHFKGYGHPADPDGDQPPWMADWLARTERQAIGVKRELVRRYDVDVVGLFPWITPELEGLVYRSRTASLNAW
jgi:hypothetical protein